jgi:hypothetical protein
MESANMVNVTVKMASLVKTVLSLLVLLNVHTMENASMVSVYVKRVGMEMTVQKEYVLMIVHSTENVIYLLINVNVKKDMQVKIVL